MFIAKDFRDPEARRSGVSKDAWRLGRAHAVPTRHDGDAYLRARRPQLWRSRFGLSSPGRGGDLDDVGRWLTRNGASIYATRGGPWKAHPWGGSTYRGATAFVHATAISGEKIDMQMPAGKRIRSVRLLNCAESDNTLEYAIKDGRLTIQVPTARQDKIDTLIEIQFYQDLSDVVPIAYQSGDGPSAGRGAAISPFDYQLVYGQRLQSGVSVTASSLATHDAKVVLAKVVTSPASAIQPFSTNRQIGAQIDVALDRAKYVTGVSLSANAEGAPLQLKGSIDGKTWTTLWSSPAGERGSSWDIGVNSFNAGGQTPGRWLRFLRIKVVGAKPRALELRRFHIWAKDGK